MLDTSQSRHSLPSDHGIQSWQNVGNLTQRQSQHRKNGCGPLKTLVLLTSGKTAAEKKKIAVHTAQTCSSYQVNLPEANMAQYFQQANTAGAVV